MVDRDTGEIREVVARQALGSEVGDYHRGLRWVPVTPRQETDTAPQVRYIERLVEGPERTLVHLVERECPSWWCRLVRWWRSPFRG